MSEVGVGLLGELELVILYEWLQIYEVRLGKLLVSEARMLVSGVGYSSSTCPPLETCLGKWL